MGKEFEFMFAWVVLLLLSACALHAHSSDKVCKVHNDMNVYNSVFNQCIHTHPKYFGYCSSEAQNISYVEDCTKTKEP